MKKCERYRSHNWTFDTLDKVIKTVNLKSESKIKTPQSRNEPANKGN